MNSRDNDPWADTATRQDNPFDPATRPEEYEVFEREAAADQARHDAAIAERRLLQQQQETDRRLLQLRAWAEADRVFAAEQAERAKRDADQNARVMDGAEFLLDVPPTPPALWGKGDDV